MESILPEWHRLFTGVGVLPAPFPVSLKEPGPADHIPPSPLLGSITLSTCLYIHFILGSQGHLSNTQSRTTSLNTNKVTVQKVSKGMLWPVSGRRRCKKSNGVSL